MRNLATIRTIKEIKPMQDADNIELVLIDGWQCVAKKGEFNVGDPCVYFEIDSLLPQIPAFDFLKNKGTKTNADGSVGYRLRTLKLRGQLSQGLALPISLFPEIQNYILYQDVSDLINVKLYEPPIPAQLQGEVKGIFPGFIRKTEQERIQNIPDILIELQNFLFEVTIKMDGTSGTFYFSNGVFGICSRNLELKENENNTYWQIAKQLDLENKLKSLNRNIAIQGEICGEGIQGNKDKIKGQQLFIFDIFDIDNQKYLFPNERYDILKQLNLIENHVRILEYKKLSDFKTVDDILGYSDGAGYNSEVREGVVFKIMKPILKEDDTISFKAINNKYLLNEK